MTGDILSPFALSLLNSLDVSVTQPRGRKPVIGKTEVLLGKIELNEVARMEDHILVRALKGGEDDIVIGKRVG